MTKLALVVLLCCVSVAFQQHPARFYVRSPLSPFYLPSTHQFFFRSPNPYLHSPANHYLDPFQQVFLLIISAINY